jgi:DNA-binding protein
MNNNIIIYNTEDGKSKINLKLEDGTVWLNQLQIAELFRTTKQNISKHIKAILEDGELNEKVAVNYQLTTTKHGGFQEKVIEKYKKYSEHTLTPVEQDYLEEIKNIKKIAKKGGK